MLEKMGSTKNNANAKVDAEVAPKVDAEVTPKVDAEVNTEISAEVDAEVYAKVAPKVNAEVDAGVAPKVSAEVDAEVVVVGGGLAGLSAAARLREHGVQVYYTAIFPSYICFIYTLYGTCCTGSDHATFNHSYTFPSWGQLGCLNKLHGPNRFVHFHVYWIQTDKRTSKE